LDDDVLLLLDEEEEDEEDEEEEEDDDDEEGEETYEEIDPSAILPRKLRRAAAERPIDYTSPEALAKAGLKPEDLEKDDEMEGRA